MRLFKKKSSGVTSPTATGSESPPKDFLLLISVILTAPFVFIWSLFTGRIRSPLLVVGFLLAVIVGFYYLSKSGNATGIKTRIIHQTLEEITPEEKERMRAQISTIRKEVRSAKVPEALHPLLDVPLDMLSINYFIYMLHSGYVAEDGGGAEHLLDAYLHSQHSILRERAWEALQNIHTEEADRVAHNYEMEIAQQNEELKKRYGDPANRPDKIEGIKLDTRDKIQDIRNKMGL